MSSKVIEVREKVKEKGVRRGILKNIKHFYKIRSNDFRGEVRMGLSLAFIAALALLGATGRRIAYNQKYKMLYQLTN